MYEIELNFPKFENEETMTTSEICVACAGCCNYVTVPLAYPRSKDQRDMYTWYLLHRNVEIYIDHDNDWQLLFKTPCDKLQSNGMCGIYADRPQLCRDYSPDSCSRTGKDYVHLFKKPDEMMAFLTERKKKTAKRASPKKKKAKVS